MSVPSFKLATGASIPAVGLGTWRSEPGAVTEAVKVALQNGYTHIDGAWAYGNEEEVGKGIKDSGVNRKDIFITGKLWCTYHSRVEQNIDETLAALGTDYLDLFLVHWPVALNPKGNDPKFPTLPNKERDIDYEWKLSDTWKQMEAVYKSGKARAIGVSNFSIKKLEELLATAEITPHANQVELHPYLPQHDLVKYCQDKNILMEAYSPLGSQDSPLMKDEDVLKVAKKHDVEVPTILLSYQVGRGVVVLPKSVTASRIKSNIKTINLDSSDMETLNNIEKRHHQRLLTPAWGNVKMGFPDWD